MLFHFFNSLLSFLGNLLNAEMPMRPYILLENFLVFLYLSVYVSLDSGGRYNPIASNLAQMFICYAKLVALIFVCITLKTSGQGNTKLSQYITVYGEKYVSIFPVCVWRKSCWKNRPIHSKFATNVYVLCKISSIVFGVHYLNNAYTGIPKITSLHCRLWRKTF